MGYYTTLNVKIKLRKDTPRPVIDFLKRVLIDKDLGLVEKVLFHTEDVFKPDFNHPFFKCERWYSLFLATNWDDDMQGGKFYQQGSYWVIDLETEFKNYDQEIDHFIDWITPYTVGRKKKQYVGWRKGENWECPRLNIYIERVTQPQGTK